LTKANRRVKVGDPSGFLPKSRRRAAQQDNLAPQH
jgi:hypothetical protein